MFVVVGRIPNAQIVLRRAETGHRGFVTGEQHRHFWESRSMNGRSVADGQHQLLFIVGEIPRDSLERGGTAHEEGAGGKNLVKTRFSHCDCTDQR